MFKKLAVIMLVLGMSLALCGLASAKEVVMFGWSAEEGASKPVIHDMLKHFTQKSGIKVKWTGAAWSNIQKNLFLKLRSKQTPDAVQLQARWLPTFARLPQIVDLNQVFGKEYLESKVAPGTLGLGRVGDRQLGLPWVAGSVGMVANLNVLKAAGVSELPVTIDEFIEVCKKVKKAKPNSVPYSLNSKNNNGIILDFQIWLWTYGGRLFDHEAKKVVVNSPESVKAVQFMVDMINSGLSAKDIDRPDSRRLFGQEEVAFYFDAPVAKAFGRKFSGKGPAYDKVIAPMATPVVKKGDTPRSVQWGHLLVMFKKDGKIPTKEDVGAKLIDYLGTDMEPQLIYFKGTGLFPVATAALGSEAVKKDPYTSAWTKHAQTALRNELAGWKSTADMTNVIGEEVQAALLGNKSAKEAVADMQKRLEPLMAKEK